MQEPEKIDFSDLNLQFGQELELLADLSQPESISPCEIIGCIVGESLIIGPPIDTGVLPLLTEGQRVAIRVKNFSGVACFQTTVLFIGEIPTLMVYLDIPREIKFRQLRKAKRVGLCLPILVDNLDDTRFSTIAGRIIDISETGARLEMCDAMGATNQSIELKGRFLVGGVERRLTLRAKIKTRVNSKTGLVYGVEFCETDEEKTLIFLCYVYQVMTSGVLQKVR